MANRWRYSKAFTRGDSLEKSLKEHEDAVNKNLHQPRPQTPPLAKNCKDSRLYNVQYNSAAFTSSQQVTLDRDIARFTCIMPSSWHTLEGD